MDNPEDRASALRGSLRDLARRFGILDVYVFGSRAAEIAARVRGEVERPGGPSASDVDVGVRPRGGAHFSVDERVDFALALEQLFDVSRVDLVVLPEAGAFLALAVVSGELLYFEDGTDQADYQLYVLRRAGDLLPFERERRTLILEHGAR
ncbi:MAG: nucleotidyltransferase family protein [Longimicrobiales bacterium]